MHTNCGVLTPRWYDTNCGLRPDLIQSHIPYFHSMLCQWAYNPVLPFFWVIVIDAQDKRHLFKSISSIGNLEPSLYSKWNVDSQSLNEVFNEQTQETVGCIFAKAVRVPGEYLTTEHFGGGANMNGHLKSPGITNRADQTLLSIDFLETNLSFADTLIRPWVVIAGYKGLVTDDGSLKGSAPYWGGSIKSNIHLYQLAKGGDGRRYSASCETSYIRQEFHFYDCVPITLNADELSYESGGFNKRQVEFVYNYYTMGRRKPSPTQSTSTFSNGDRRPTIAEGQHNVIAPLTDDERTQIGALLGGPAGALGSKAYNYYYNNYITPTVKKKQN